VPEELADLLEPARSALVLVDLQVDFCRPEGAFGRLGADLSAYDGVLQQSERLLHSARAAGVLVVHLQNTQLPADRASSPAQRRFARRLQQRFRPDGPFEPVCVLGSAGWEFVPEVAPLPDEPVVPKYRSSGFAGTPLDLLLRSNAISTLVIVGATTEGCVESTGRDAMFGDYAVVIVEDAVGSDDPALHEASMLLMRNRFDVVPAGFVTSMWKAGS
jgi:nicotinamidase-related amidase